MSTKRTIITPKPTRIRGAVGVVRY
jgi:hypothetical protein